MPHSLVPVALILVQLTLALTLWVAWRSARRRAEGLERLASQSAELRQVLDRAHAEQVELRGRSQALAALVGPDDRPPPPDPVQCLDRVEQQLRNQLAALSRQVRVEQQLRQDLTALREDLQLAQRREQEARGGGSGAADATLPVSTELLESLAQQTATRMQLRTAQREVEELRARLQFADQAIADLERRLREPRTTAPWPEDGGANDRAEQRRAGALRVLATES